MLTNKDFKNIDKLMDALKELEQAGLNVSNVLFDSKVFASFDKLAKEYGGDRWDIYEVSDGWNDLHDLMDHIDKALKESETIELVGAHNIRY